MSWGQDNQVPLGGKPARKKYAQRTDGGDYNTALHYTICHYNILAISSCTHTSPRLSSTHSRHISFEVSIQNTNSSHSLHVSIRQQAKMFQS